jgi:hypothetical protein
MHITKDRRWFWGGLAVAAFTLYDMATGFYASAFLTSALAAYLLINFD